VALKSVRFGPAEVTVLQTIQPISEELVGEHFRLTSFGPVRRCYDVVTLESAGPEGRDPLRLAKLCRYDRKERSIDTDHKRVSRFYRVHLQDDRLLTRTGEGLSLRALLLYVLTHELIHIVRFESFQVHYGMTGAARNDEERTVHHLTEIVLRKLRDPQVEEVIEGLDPEGVDVVELQQ
jgi:hypothetical protein